MSNIPVYRNTGIKERRRCSIMNLYEKNLIALRKFKKWLKMKQEEEQFHVEFLDLEDDEEIEHLLETDEVEDYII